jgi:hypothetical protein
VFLKSSHNSKRCKLKLIFPHGKKEVRKEGRKKERRLNKPSKAH